jgi:hypothetical protein
MKQIASEAPSRPTLIVSESSTLDTLSLNTRTNGLLRSTIAGWR